MSTYSVVVPCYNCEKTIDRCLSSLIAQILPFYEIILVDDGSTDHTGKKCDGYAVIHANVKVIHKENGGLVSAWKEGVANSTGEYVLFCDADDFVDNDLLSVIDPEISASRPDMAAYGFVAESAERFTQKYDIRVEAGYYNREEINKEILPRIFFDGDMVSAVLYINRWNKVFRRELLKSVEKDVPDEISLGEDQILSFSYIINSFSIYVFDSFLPYHYVRSKESMTGNIDDTSFYEAEKTADVLDEISTKYGYTNSRQLLQQYLCNIFTCMRVMICDDSYSYGDVRKSLIKAMSSPRFSQNVSTELIKSYNLPSRVFAWLMIKRFIMPAYVITKAVVKLECIAFKMMKRSRDIWLK